MSAFIYKGSVMHRRLKPVVHHFKYRVFSLLLDLDRLDDLDKELFLFSRNRFNLYSFYDRDFATGQERQDLANHVRGVLREAKINADGPIRLLCYPRMFGYAFNPLSVYYCYDGDQKLTAVLYEVSSTFGERHTYLVPIINDDNIVRTEAGKLLHVSPFMDMDMRYRFRLSKPDDQLSLSIRQLDQDGPILNAIFSGKRAPLSDRALIGAFFAYPLMTFKIMFGIHWQAVRLMAKGMRLLAGPKAPAEPVTLVAPEEQLRRHQA